MKYTILSKELLTHWFTLNTLILIRQKFLLSMNLSIISAKTNDKLSFTSDSAYIWKEGEKCLVMKWEELAKIEGEFSYISSHHFKNWLFTEKPINNEYENRLQKQEIDVVRGDDTEGNRVQSRKCKASVTVGYLSYKSVKG